jgi:hypothetical protein
MVCWRYPCTSVTRRAALPLYHYRQAPPPDPLQQPMRGSALGTHSSASHQMVQHLSSAGGRAGREVSTGVSRGIGRGGRWGSGGRLRAHPKRRQRGSRHRKAGGQGAGYACGHHRTPLRRACMQGHQHGSRLGWKGGRQGPAKRAAAVPVSQPRPVIAIAMCTGVTAGATAGHATQPAPAL